MRPHIDLTGRQFGKFTVLAREPSGRDRKTRWLVLCHQCHKQIVVSQDTLVKGRTKQCGCFNLAGRRFGRLLVLARWSHLQRGPTHYICVCDCGTFLVKPALYLTSGDTSSCGCYRKEVMAKKQRRHGMRWIPEYSIWLSMKERCENPRQKSYARYGGRGITVDPRWREDFMVFFTDMGPRPSPQHSLERTDNDKGYCPRNVVWATQIQQANNTSRNRRITFGGETRTLAEWARKYDISQANLLWRLQKGLDFYTAVTTPVRRRLPVHTQNPSSATHDRAAVSRSRRAK
jgi:hypothetical protein